MDLWVHSECDYLDSVPLVFSFLTYKLYQIYDFDIICIFI